MINNASPLLMADWYKVSHISMYHKDTEFLQSNLTPRSDRLYPHFVDDDHSVMFAGIQGFIKWFFVEMFENNFFHVPKEEALKPYKEACNMAIGEGKVDFSGFERLHDLGYLPLEIRALPEGILSPVGVPVYTIQNTVSGFAWLVNYFESAMSAETWKTTTTATTSYQYNKLCHKFAELTCDNKEHVPFQCHMFAFRGQAGMADAAQSEFGHLMNFTGTDTIPSIWYANKYYNMEGKFVAASVPATEHSVATTNISYIMEDENSESSNVFLSKDVRRGIAEMQFIKELITENYPTGFISYVADSYDYFKVITEILPCLKEEIMNRDGKLIIRPDSGVPENIIAGYRWSGVEYNSQYEVPYDHEAGTLRSEVIKVNGNFYKFEQADTLAVCKNRGLTKNYVKLMDYPHITEHEVKGSIEILWETFGGEVNSKGYKVLDSHIGLIYGDSITVKRAEDIFKRLEEKGFASSNVVYGVGSYTTQYVTRDSLGFAVKATGAVIGGKDIMVSKEPKTDMGKRSAKGFLKVVKGNETGELRTVPVDSLEKVQEEDNELRVIFKDGQLIVDETLETIRERVQDNFRK